MNYLKLYTDFLKKAASIKKPLKVVFDCSNGTTGKVLEELFQKPNKSYRTNMSNKTNKLKVILINENPDGNFPAHGPNPMLEWAMDDLSKAVLKNKADLGVIFDADGDRVFFVDDKGKPVIPDAAISLLAKNFKGLPAGRHGQAGGRQGRIVLPVNVGMFLKELLAKEGRKVFDSRIGHYFMKKIIKEKKINFAAEPSGHYYFQKFFYADSGIFAAIQFINAVSRLPRSLSGFVNEFPVYYQSGEINFTIREKEAALKKVETFYKNRAKKISHLDGLTMQFNNWWFSLRPSNTEDLLRLNLEAKEKKVFDRFFAEITRLVNS